MRVTRVKICGIRRRRGRAAGRGARRRRDRVRLLAGAARGSSIRTRRAPIVAALPPFVHGGRRLRRSAADVGRCDRRGRCGLGAVQLHGRRGAGQLMRALQCRSSRRSPSTTRFDACSDCDAVPADVDRAARRPRPGQARRHRADDRLDAARRRVAHGRPVILSGGLNAENVARGDRAVQPVRRGRVVRRRVGARRQGPGQAARVLRAPMRDHATMDLWTTTNIGHLSSVERDPDARGYYGAYGGRFVPETLVAPVAGARARLFRGARGPGVRRDAARICLRNYVGRPTPLYEARRLAAVARRRAHLPQARGSRPHRRAQDQQRARPGAARAADGEAARDRRDRRRPARRRHRDRLRAARPRVRRLHGRRGHGAAVAQRLPHAAARRDGPPGRRRQPHAEGRDQRGDARLGRQRRGQLLPARLGARPASVPADGARVPVGDRPGGARADPRAHRPPARRDRRLRRRRQQRHGHLRRVRRRRGRPADRRRGRRPRHSRRASTRRGSPAAAPACSRARAPTCCRTTTATSS